MNRPRQYYMPRPPGRLTAKQRGKVELPPFDPPAAPVIVDKATECHVTPPDVAARMVGYLGRAGDFHTLEPSAGTGALVRALLESGHSKRELCQVERHAGLAAGLAQYGPVINRCFLEWADEVRGKVEFPRIIMNPPFSQVRAHIRAARSLLGRNGHSEPPRLVALVPSTFEAEGADVLENLPDTTFAAARVRTKIIRIEASSWRSASESD